MSVFVIAEIGINHIGDMGKAYTLIEAAAAAGADAVKFQSYDVERLGYSDNLLNKMLQDFRLDQLQHIELKTLAELRGIEFMSTPFDAGWCDFLAQIGVKRMKISSGRVKDLNFVKHVASKGLPVIMSSGMASYGEIDDACLACNDVKTALLYCVSEYPAPLSSVNFMKMGEFHDDFTINTVGFSDHTANPATCVLAAAAGARIVEAHLTLDRSLPGPDHVASLLPEEFKQMVEGVRRVRS